MMGGLLGIGQLPQLPFSSPDLYLAIASTAPGGGGLTQAPRPAGHRVACSRQDPWPLQGGDGSDLGPDPEARILESAAFHMRPGWRQFRARQGPCPGRTGHRHHCHLLSCPKSAPLPCLDQDGMWFYYKEAARTRPAADMAKRRQA